MVWSWHSREQLEQIYCLKIEKFETLWVAIELGKLENVFVLAQCN